MKINKFKFFSILAMCMLLVANLVVTIFYVIDFKDRFPNSQFFSQILSCLMITCLTIIFLVILFKKQFQDSPHANKKIKYFYMVMFGIVSVLFFLEIVKFFIYWSHRDAYFVDFQWISIYFSQFIFLFLWFIFAINFCKNGAFRKTTLVLFIASIVDLGIKLFQKINELSTLFLSGNETTPPRLTYLSQ